MRGAGFLVLVILAIVLLSGDANAADKPKRPKVDPKPGPGGGGRVWRLPGSGGGALPTDEEFDYGGNGLFVDPECQYAIEGNLFWPTEGFGLMAEEAPTLEATLAIEGNSVVGYIDYLTEQQGMTQPYEIAAQILSEVAPMCASVPDDQWGDGLFAWYSSFVDRVSDYLDAQIGFGGDGE